MADPDRNKFLQEAKTKAPGPFAEFLGFLRHEKKWWLTPIVVVILLAGILILLAGTGVAPFIYTLF
jgi:hypothetical protein